MVALRKVERWFSTAKPRVGNGNAGHSRARRWRCQATLGKGRAESGSVACCTVRARLGVASAMLLLLDLSAHFR